LPAPGLIDPSEKCERFWTIHWSLFRTGLPLGAAISVQNKKSHFLLDRSNKPVVFRKDPTPKNIKYLMKRHKKWHILAFPTRFDARVATDGGGGGCVRHQRRIPTRRRLVWSARWERAIESSRAHTRRECPSNSRSSHARMSACLPKKYMGVRRVEFFSLQTLLRSSMFPKRRAKK
jgi:hypothetical protein